MRHNGKQNYALESVAGPGDLIDGRYADSDEYADLASALCALTGDDFSSLSVSLNAVDTWDVDDTSGHCGGGFMANQF